MVYPIVKFGDPVLEREGDNITEFDTPELHKLLDDMFESMYAAKGVGLAAPQIGISKKIAVIDCSNGENPGEKLILINPRILVLDAEYDEVQPLYLISFPPGGLHMAKPMKTLETLAGLKIANGSKVGADTITRLGGAPISMVTSEYYTAIQRGLVDGASVPWTAMQPFKLADVAFFHVEAELGGTAGMVFMNKKKYLALPAAAPKLIDDNSGEAQSRVYGKFWDDVDGEGRDATKALGAKHQFVNLPPEIEAKWREAITPLTADWVKATPYGEKVLSTFRAKIAEVRAGR